MPNRTESDYLLAYGDLEASWYVPTLVPSASGGTSVPNAVLVKPDMWVMKTRWNGKKVTMKTIDGHEKEIELVKEPTLEEIQKHAHNPRGLNGETRPPAAFFQKDLPSIGQQNLWIRTGAYDWSISYCAPALIHQNDESTVFFQTANGGLCGYICTCHFCKMSWDVKDSSSVVRGSSWEHEYNHLVRLGNSRYQRRYIGHLGAITRGVRLGLVLADSRTCGRKHSEGLCYLNTVNTPGMTARGLLKGWRDDTTEYAVPTFLEPGEAPAESMPNAFAEMPVAPMPDAPVTYSSVSWDDL